MPFTSAEKKEVLEKYAIHEKDTGSPEVQIALMTEHIRNLTEHFKAHKHDNNSKRGLMRLVGRRKRMLRYLHRISVERYTNLIGTLGIRGSY